MPNDGLRAVNVYAVETSEGLVLIDSGWAVADARTRLASGLAARGFGLGDIRRFLVTHVHRDHYTQAIAVRRDFGTRVSLGADEEPTLRANMDPDRTYTAIRQRRLIAQGAPDFAREVGGLLPDPPASDRIRNWELPDDWLHGGGRVVLGSRTLDIVATPGHTSGHVVFVDDPSGLLFAGDHVLPQITPSISLEAVGPPNPLGAFLDSLALVRAMPDRMLLPAHGPVTASVHARVDELIAHHGQRLDECERAVLAGDPTVYAVAGALRWTRHGYALSELDAFNRMMAIGETGAHLTLLVAQGRLSVRDLDGVIHYAAP